MTSRIVRVLSLALTSLAPLAFLTASASAQLVLTTDPPAIGPGDDVLVQVDGGDPGDVPIVAAALDAGPIKLPIVGSLDVGLEMLAFYVLPAFDDDGHAQFLCPLPCAATRLDPFYLQAIAVHLGPPVSVPLKSNQLVLTIDDELIQDCNGDDVDDQCQDLPDCNGNGVPDVCDLAAGTSSDRNQNGVPDECEDCLAPTSAGQAGRWRILNNHNTDLLAPPAFGLRLDGLLDGDCDKGYTFDLEAPGSALYLDFDGVSKVRISGTVWGGLDVGDAWDPFEQSFLCFDFCYEDAEVQAGPLGPLVVVPETARSYGTATWKATGQVVPLTGKASLANNVQFLMRDTPGGVEMYCWFDLGAGCEADIPLTDLVGEDTCECGPPAKGGDEGTWKLGNKVVGQVAPPDYGLRLDGLFGDYPTHYTFDFEHPGACVFLTYDGSSVRIHGAAFGGKDVGDDWDPLVRSWVWIDVLWEGAVEDDTHCEVRVPEGSSVTGSLTWLADGTVVPLQGASNMGNLLTFYRDATTTDLATWLSYETGSPGCCQDINSHVSTPIDDCPERTD